MGATLTINLIISNEELEGDIIFRRIAVAEWRMDLRNQRVK
jgi:hypothetical protein